MITRSKLSSLKIHIKHDHLSGEYLYYNILSKKFSSSKKHCFSIICSAMFNFVFDTKIDFSLEFFYDIYIFYVNRRILNIIK